MSHAIPKVGVLGGTFDPIHCGHLLVAETVREKLGLDRVYMVTAKNPPHKSHRIADAELRHAMVEAAVRNKPHLIASRMELEREGKSYTVDTIKALQKELGPHVEIYLIVSVEYLVPDLPASLPNWEGARELFSLCRIAVTPSRQMDAAMARQWAQRIPAADIVVVDLESPDISSLMVKRHIQHGRSIENLVPEAVETFIYAAGLYQDAEVLETR